MEKTYIKQLVYSISRRNMKKTLVIFGSVLTIAILLVMSFPSVVCQRKSYADDSKNSFDKLQKSERTEEICVYKIKDNLEKINKNRENNEWFPGMILAFIRGWIVFLSYIIIGYLLTHVV